MKLLIEWEGFSRILQPDQSYVLGRDDNCDICFPERKISRNHLRFFVNLDKWIVQDLASANGTYSGNKKISSLEINNSCILYLGGKSTNKVKISVIDNESAVYYAVDQTRQFAASGPNVPEVSDKTGRIRLQKRLRIGREKANDWVIESQNASRLHAEIIQNGNNFEIVDLKSTNGTYVNGYKINRAVLSTGDKLTIAGVSRVFTQAGLEPIEGVSGTPIQIEKLSFSIGEKTLIDGVNLNIGASTLTAVIGPSGAGKSTLLALLAGRLKPSQGSIKFDGYELEQNYELLIRQIGLVPQSDILHTNLSVSDALSFGASLRLPDDTSKKDKTERVNYVMTKLELAERANLRIDKLSGGQRKRASIGLELLTSPQVLLLDEPTSGLDPGLDAHVMETLRNLADEGQTVVVVTHSVDNLEFCDNVVLMASGGKLIYSGPVSSVFKQLGKNSWAEVFRLLATPEVYELALEKHESPVDSKQLITNLDSKKRSRFKQITTLSARYFKVISADKFYLSLLALIPILIGLIAYVAGSKYGLGSGYKSEFGFQLNPYAQGTILILILGSVFIGLATSIQEIIKEKPIRIREQAVGVRANSYLLSKVIVLTLIIIAQMILFVNIVLYGRPVNSTGLIFANSRFEITILCVLLGISAMILGLLLSAFLTTNEQAMPALVGATMIQVVLSGVLPISSSGLIENLSKFSPSYWVTNSIASSINLVQIARVMDSSRQIKWDASRDNMMNSIIFLSGMIVLFYLLTFLKLRKINRG